MLYEYSEDVHVVINIDTESYINLNDATFKVDPKKYINKPLIGKNQEPITDTTTLTYTVLVLMGLLQQVGCQFNTNASKLKETDAKNTSLKAKNIELEDKITTLETEKAELTQIKFKFENFISKKAGTVGPKRKSDAPVTTIDQATAYSTAFSGSTELQSFISDLGLTPCLAESSFGRFFVECYKQVFNAYSDPKQKSKAPPIHELFYAFMNNLTPKFESQFALLKRYNPTAIYLKLMLNVAPVHQNFVDLRIYRQVVGGVIEDPFVFDHLISLLPASDAIDFSDKSQLKDALYQDTIPASHKRFFDLLYANSRKVNAVSPGKTDKIFTDERVVKEVTGSDRWFTQNDMPRAFFLPCSSRTLRYKPGSSYHLVGLLFNYDHECTRVIADKKADEKTHFKFGYLKRYQAKGKSPASAEFIVKEHSPSHVAFEFDGELVIKKCVKEFGCGQQVSDYWVNSSLFLKKDIDYKSSSGNFIINNVELLDRVIEDGMLLKAPRLDTSLVHKNAKVERFTADGSIIESTAADSLGFIRFKVPNFEVGLHIAEGLVNSDCGSNPEQVINKALFEMIGHADYLQGKNFAPSVRSHGSLESICVYDENEMSEICIAWFKVMVEKAYQFIHEGRECKALEMCIQGPYDEETIKNIAYDCFGYYDADLLNLLKTIKIETLDNFEIVDKHYANHPAYSECRFKGETMNKYPKIRQSFARYGERLKSIMSTLSC